MAKEYDLIVVGGGPGGLVAAWTASALGARVVCLEEHPQIGIPRHCSGMIAGSSFAEDLFKVIDNRVIECFYTRRRVFGPSGKLIAELDVSGRGCCLVLRDEFDRELARQAVKAGAELRVNTRVTGIWREGNRVRGVFIKGGDEKISGQVVIAADGLYALQKGIPRQEGLTPPDQQFRSGLNIELTGARDLETGVMEFHWVNFLTSASGCGIYTRDSSSCFMGFDSLRQFERVKSLNLPIGRKFKDAVPIRIMGFSFTEPYGLKRIKAVRDGLLIIGDAAGYSGATHAMVSGKYAAQVAVKAIADEDTSEARLQEYEELCKVLESYGMASCSLANLWGLSDEAVEEKLTKMARRNELNFLDQHRF